MAEHMTSLYDLYHRPNDEGKLVNPDGSEFIFAEKGSGSKRGKAMLLSDLKSWILPGNGEIGTNDIANLAVTESKIAGASISTSKLQNGAVTLDKLDEALKRQLITAAVESETVMQANVDNGLLATITNSVTFGRILDLSVRFRLMAVTPEYADSNFHDCKIELRVVTPGTTPTVIASKRLTWKYGDMVEARLCGSDTYSIRNSSIKLYVVRTESSGTSGTSSYWPGSPSTGLVAYHTDVQGVMP